MTKTLEKKLYWLYLAGIFLIATLPLISAPPLLHPSSFAKSILFKSIFSVLLFLFSCQLLFLNNKEILDKIKFYAFNKKNRVFIPLLLLTLLGLIYILSTIFSLEPYFSFWGNPSRGGGSLIFIFLILFSIFVFLIIKQKDWQKLWDFNFIIGILISIVAIFQKFSIFSNFLLPQTDRPYSTMGGSAFLAAYLLLLIFPALSFGFEKLRIKSIFYFLAIAFFIIGIFLSATRAVILALGIGFLLFLFLYPRNKQIKNRMLFILKITAVVLIFLTILGAFWLSNKPEITSKMENFPVIGNALYRTWQGIQPLFEGGITFQKIVSQGRYSGWQILWPALNDRPILGYGPENISIPFDKYYNPSIPGITSGFDGSGSGWWDKAHNIFLETGITIGIPGLIIYVLIFIIFIITLQKIKKERLENSVKAFGLQIAFIAYFIATFFSFDTMSTYIILFILIGYSLFLIKEKNIPLEQKNNALKEKPLWSYILITVLFFALIWFLWAGNIKPLKMNGTLNNASFAPERQKCQGISEIMDPLLFNHSFIDNYVRLKYIDFISICIGLENTTPYERLEFIKKAVPILQETKELRPNYTRTWLYSAIFLNKLAEADTSLTSEQRKDLLENALEDLEKTKELSPTRTDLFLTEVKTYLLLGDIDNAFVVANKCIAFSPDMGDCYWAKALVLISKGEQKSDETIWNIKKALENIYTVQGKNTLKQLIIIYVKLTQETQDIKYYEILKELYIELAKIDPDDFQTHASLAYAYAILGEYDKAREEAEIVLKLSPESEPNVRAFLDSLPD